MLLAIDQLWLLYHLHHVCYSIIWSRNCFFLRRPFFWSNRQSECFSMRKPKKEHQKRTPETFFCFVLVGFWMWLFGSIYQSVGPLGSRIRYSEMGTTRSRRHQLQHGFFLRKLLHRLQESTSAHVSWVRCQVTQQKSLSIHLSLTESRVVTYVNCSSR